MPANSLTTSPVFASRTQIRATAVSRSENCSRIKAPIPLPVKVPRRTDISCTNTRATVTITMKNNVR